MYILLVILLILQSSCDEQSNPYIGEIESVHLEDLNYESRDVLVLNDIEVDIFDCSILEESLCNEDIWCNWDEDQCLNTSNDLLIVANQYEEGLIVYDINSMPNGMIELDKIYSNNNFEVLNEASIENDLEIRQLAYDANYKMLYILDKFEYIYQIWLPTILETDNFKISGSGCYDVSGAEDGIWDPIQIKTFIDGEKLHATQLIMDQNNPGDYEIIYLLKYNTEISSDSNIPDPSQTSCSRLGSYHFYLDLDFSNNEQACSGNFIFNTYNIDMSPLFDYGVTDIYKNNNKIIIANTYDPYVFKDELGTDLNISYYEDVYQDGCSLPNNSISMKSDGKLLYNISSELNYFEFNLVNTDLSEYYPEILTNYFYQYPANAFEGFINEYSDVAVSISSNKVMGYVAPSGNNISPRCGTLIDLELNQDGNVELIDNNKYSISVYDYTDINSDIIYNYDIKTNSKPTAVFNNEDYLIAGLDDDGCYITLLGDNTHEMTKFGCDDFRVNDIVYDQSNNKLLLSCGNDGVLIYHWVGVGIPIFENHIISSHAYKAQVYVDDQSNAYIIIATKYGVEIYSL